MGINDQTFEIQDSNITIDEINLHPSKRVRTIAEIYKGDIEREGFLRRGESPLDGSYFASILTESGKIFVYIHGRLIKMLLEENVEFPTKYQLDEIGWGLRYYKILARYI